MKLSCFEMLVGDRPLAEKFAMIRDAGFDGIDLRGDLLHGNVDEAVQLRDQTGLDIATVYGRLTTPLLSATQAERTKALDLLRLRLTDAAAAGVDRMVVVPVTGPPRVEVDLGDGVESVEWALLGVLLTEVLAEAPTVTMVLEPLNARETHFIRSPSEAAQFTRHIGNPMVGTMIDTYHVDLEGQDPVAELDTVGDQLRLVHLSDRERTLPGEGGIDFAPVVGKLDEMGYEGYGGFECRGPFTVEQLAKSVDWVRSLS